MGGEWRLVRLEDLVEIRHGYAFQGDFMLEDAFGDVLLTPGNFKPGGGFTAAKLKHYDGPVPEEFVLCEGDLLVTMTDLSRGVDTLGYPALVPRQRGEHRYLHNQRLGKVVPKPGADLSLRFLYYLLCGTEYRSEILASATGTTVKHTAPSRIGRFRFHCPSRDYQGAIADILGTLDDKIDLNRRMSETLEAMARALFKSWFVDFDPVRAKAEGRDLNLPKAIADLFPDSLEEADSGPTPKGWRLASITELQANRPYACVAGPFGSNLTSRDYTDSGVPVIRGANLSNGSIWLRERDFVFVTEAKADSLAGCLAYPGDVVFTQRGTLGQVSVIPEDSVSSRFLLSQSQMKIAARPEAAAAFYIALYFRQQSVVDYIVANGQQAGVPHINLGFLRAFRMLLPPDGVLQAFDAIVRPLFKGVRARDHESETLAALRNTLLPKLISGELRIPDAERIVGEVA